MGGRERNVGREGKEINGRGTEERNNKGTKGHNF